MTTDVQLFKSGVPAYLKAQPLNAITKSLLGSGKTTKKISIRGNVFRLVVNGKEIATSEERSMKVVLVNVAPKVHRTFYAGVFDPTVKAGPQCWSADGERPDESIDAPQSDACHNCEKNIAGSGTGKTKACKFGRMLAVVLENDLSGDVFQLSLPAQSIFGDADGGKMPLNAYAQFLAGFNVNVTAVVTEMRFDTDSATPKLFFKAVRPLTEEEYDALSQRGETPEVKAMVKVSFRPQADVAPADVPKLPNKAKAKDANEEVEAEEPTQPKKRDSKKEEPSTKKNLAAVLDQWDDEE
jgi:hypothetical protein